MVFIGYSKIHQPADHLYGADTTCFSNSRHQKVSLDKAVELLNELAVTLSELVQADPASQHTAAASDKP